MFPGYSAVSNETASWPGFFCLRTDDCSVQQLKDVTQPLRAMESLSSPRVYLSFRRQGWAFTGYEEMTALKGAVC